MAKTAKIKKTTVETWEVPEAMIEEIDELVANAPEEDADDEYDDAEDADDDGDGGGDEDEGDDEDEDDDEEVE